jgi:hypothetical protein
MPITQTPSLIIKFSHRNGQHFKQTASNGSVMNNAPAVTGPGPRLFTWGGRMINGQATPDPSHLQGRGRSARRPLRTNGPERRDGAWRDGEGGWLETW